jgi:hypothetical protein
LLEALVASEEMLGSPSKKLVDAAAAWTADGADGTAFMCLQVLELDYLKMSFKSEISSSHKNSSSRQKKSKTAPKRQESISVQNCKESTFL